MTYTFKGRALAMVGIAAGIAGCIGGLWFADATPPAEVESATTATIPYCQVDREVPDHLTVAGPANGAITVDGKWVGVLVLITDDDYGDEVRPDAEPFSGILYNVEGPGTVAVDGVVCETT